MHLVLLTSGRVVSGQYLKLIPKFDFAGSLKALCDFFEALRIWHGSLRSSVADVGLTTSQKDLCG